MKNWLPYRLQESSEYLNCRWLWIDDVLFTDPFFDETISRFRRLKENRKNISCESSMDMMEVWSGELSPAEPKAIIFHVSRCGSTLLSQQLSLDSSNIVLSEVPFLDDILRWGFRTNQKKKATHYFKVAMRFYGNKRNRDQQRVFIKTDSWHIHFYQQLRDIYPATPFILLFRKPDEIIRSQKKQRGLQAVPGMIEPELFGFEKEKLHFAELDLHMALVLETYYRSFLETAKKDPLALLCNYAEGMDTVFENMLRFANITLNDENKKLILERGKYHAKRPEQIFQETVMHEVIPEYMQKAMELYLELESLRSNLRPHTE